MVHGPYTPRRRARGLNRVLPGERHPKLSLLPLLPWALKVKLLIRGHTHKGCGVVAKPSGVGDSHPISPYAATACRLRSKSATCTGKAPSSFRSSPRTSHRFQAAGRSELLLSTNNTNSTRQKTPRSRRTRDFDFPIHQVSIGIHRMACSVQMQKLNRLTSFSTEGNE